MIGFERCPGCGSTQSAEYPCREGPHHAKLTCGGCGRFIKFIPKPVEPCGKAPPALCRAAAAAVRPVSLRGTSAQVKAAILARQQMIAEARESRDFPRVLVLKAIADASWFLANRAKAPGEVRWPLESQMARDGVGVP